MFGTRTEYIVHKYSGLGFPTSHITQCITTWNSIPKQEWMHLFLHTLDTILKNWYIELKVHRGTKN